MALRRLPLLQSAQQGHHINYGARVVAVVCHLLSRRCGAALLTSPTLVSPDTKSITRRDLHKGTTLHYISTLSVRLAAAVVTNLCIAYGPYM